MIKITSLLLASIFTTAGFASLRHNQIDIKSGLSSGAGLSFVKSAT